MKNWTIPVAREQKFAANEYVSACYNIMCVTPLGNSPFGLIVDDTNGNGAYDAGSDQVVFDPNPSGQTWLAGCGRWHEVEIVGDVPTKNNGFVTGVNFPTVTTPTTPAYYWYGAVIGDPVAENAAKIYDDIHVTDLTQPGVITESSKS